MNFEIRSDWCNLNSTHTDSNRNHLNSLAQYLGIWPNLKTCDNIHPFRKKCMTGVSQTEANKILKISLFYYETNIRELWWYFTIIRFRYLYQCIYYHLHCASVMNQPFVCLIILPNVAFVVVTPDRCPYLALIKFLTRFRTSLVFDTKYHKVFVH